MNRHSMDGIEFPRQQKESSNKPEIMQFKTNQRLQARLMNPNRNRQVSSSNGNPKQNANTQTAGALSVADFVQAFDKFDETPAENITSINELQKRLREFNNFLTDSNKNWSQKSKMLNNLRGCLLVNDIPQVVDGVMKNCGLWEQCLIDGLKELRSTLTKDYCFTTAFFAKKLGGRFIRQVELMLTNLMLLVQNTSSKIMSSSGVILSELIARYVQHSKLIPLTSKFLVSKASVVRRTVVQMFAVMLSSWGQDILELHLNVIKEVIKSGLNDADLSCRSTSQDTYFAFSEKFPNQSQELYDSLDTIRQRALNDQQRSVKNSMKKKSNEVYKEPISSTNKINDSNGLPHNTHLPVYHPGRSDNTSTSRIEQKTVAEPKTNGNPDENSIISIPKPASADDSFVQIKHRLEDLRQRIENDEQLPVEADPAATQQAFLDYRSRSDVHFRNNEAPTIASTPPSRSLNTSSIRSNQLNPSSSKSRPAVFAKPLFVPKSSISPVNKMSISSTESLNGNGVSPIQHSLQDIIENLSVQNADLIKPTRIIEALNALITLITTNQLHHHHYAAHFDVLLEYCTQLLGISEASNMLKMAVLDALRVLITAQPVRAVDKAEMVLHLALDAQDCEDAALKKAAEDCGVVIIELVDTSKNKAAVVSRSGVDASIQSHGHCGSVADRSHGAGASSQQGFLENQSRSEVQFGAPPMPYAPPSRSLHTSPTRINQSNRSILPPTPRSLMYTLAREHAMLRAALDFEGENDQLRELLKK